jgi:hypothetical protein
MSEPDRNKDAALRETAYFIWEREGRPQGQAEDHWKRAVSERSSKQRRWDDDPMMDEERILAGRPDVNIPALLTKDVPGG